MVKVLIKPDPIQEQTKSGIYLSKENAEEIATPIGTVLQIGQDKKTNIKPGDKVYYIKFATNIVKYEKQDYLIISEDDILLVIR